MLTSCTHCHNRFIVPESRKGRAAKCSICGERFLIEPRLDRLNLVSDEEDLAKRLHLPTLDDIEECDAPPDVAAAVPPGAKTPVIVPTVKPPETLDYVQGRQSIAVLLLVLWSIAIGIYGMFMSKVPPALAAARDEGLDIAVNNWDRVWIPLLLGSMVSLVAVAGCFWLGAQLAARGLRMRYQSIGVLESLAIASVPTTFPLLAAVAFGTNDARVVVPATVMAFPVVCLLVPALFGIPLARGLTAAVICVAVAAPAYVLGSMWWTKQSTQALAMDDRRIERAIQLAREAVPDRPSPPVAPPPTDTAVQLPPEAARVIEQLQQAVAQDPAAAPASYLNIPSPPPPTAVPETPAATTQVPVAALSPDLALTAPPAVSPAPIASLLPARSAIPEPPPDSRLSLWREAGNPINVVWPATPGQSFATVRLDRFGNHLLDFWSCADLERQGALCVGGGEVTYAICPAGATLLRVVDGAAPVAEIWSLAQGVRQAQLQLSPDQQHPQALGFLDHQTFAILSLSGNDVAVDVLDVKRPVPRRRIAWKTEQAGKPSYSARNVAITPDGKSLLLVDGDGQLRLIDTTSGAVRRSWVLNLAARKGAEVTSIAVSPDGANVAVLMDETAAINESVLFTAVLGRSDLQVTCFSEPLWKQAGVVRTPDTRSGRSLDWVAPGRVLAYGELVIDVVSGAIVDSMHPRTESTGAGPAALAQYPLGDGTFVLDGLPDQQGAPGALYRLVPTPEQE